MSTKSQRGYSLVEMVLYIATLSFLLIVIITILINIISLEKQLTASRAIENSAAFGLERMVREVRGAKSVDVVGSILDTNPGKLVLSSTDSGGSTETVEFSVASGLLRLKINGVDQGALTQSKATVTRFVVSRMATTSSEAVRIQLTLESGTSTAYRSANFYSTDVLRGSL